MYVMTNMSAWAVNDKVRIQVIDSKGNGEVWYVKPQGQGPLRCLRQLEQSILFVGSGWIGLLGEVR